MVIWIIGLSASGKSRLGKCVYEELKKEDAATVLIDGDEIRRIFRHDLTKTSYTLEGRRINAERICGLCAWLDKQNINVVCCILSIFKESRYWNRRTYSKYFEVYLDVPYEKLKERETKGLYAGAEKGEIKNVVGIDIPFAPPEEADYIFNNSEDNVDFTEVAIDILKKAKKI